VIDASGWLETDRRWMRDLGWWTLDALLTTEEIVRPPGLQLLAVDLSRGLVPEQPVQLGHPR
jgi:hypothetical protein